MGLSAVEGWWCHGLLAWPTWVFQTSRLEHKHLVGLRCFWPWPEAFGDLRGFGWPQMGPMKIRVCVVMCAAQ